MAQKNRNKCPDCGKYGSFADPDNPIQFYCKSHKLEKMTNLKICSKWCVELGCKTTANFGIYGQKPSHCVTHKTDDMSDLKNKRCEESGCKTSARFGIKDTFISHCKTHKTAEMVPLYGTCKKCTKKPSFNFKDKTRPEFCKDHAEIGMVDLKHEKCELCDKRPSFNIEGETKAKFCRDHADKYMIDLKNKHCEKCDKQPYFNDEGKLQGRFCKEHAEKGMVDVKSKKCEKCDKRPYFNDKDKSPRFCKDHATEDMVDVKNKRCEKCDKRPRFNIKGATNGRFCREHADEGMVNIIDKKCEKCDKLPSFNDKYSTSPRFCKEHAEENMVDVRHTLCKCGAGVSFNFIGYSPIYCSKCKEPNMIHNPIKRCKCKKLATRVKDTVFYCDKHTIADAIDIYELCIICFNKTEIGQQICNSCTTTIEAPTKRHLKELQILRHLEDNKINIYSYDKALGASKRRPDFVIKYATNNIIVIECDEFQHQRTSYTCECEITRMKQIYFDLFKPVETKIRDTEEDACAASNDIEELENKLLFIRYNPDNYKSESAPFITIRRLEYLEQYIKNFNFDEMESGLYVKYLFYDMFIPTDLMYDLDKINPYL